VTASVLEFAGVSKHFGGLRPLRIRDLRVESGDRVTLVGLDAPAGETFVNLATGATLPDEGEVKLFGRPTSAIIDGHDWLATIDRVGIVSARAVLLEQMTVVQNLALPFTLAIEPPPEPERLRAESLAREVGLAERCWTAALRELDATAAMKVRVGRALALDPQMLLLEHPTASIEREQTPPFGAALRALAERRSIAVVAVTADEAFARELGATLLTLQPVSGALSTRGRGWFGRRS
jgi:predicted ABC-type transport system involved in lysophospholipase L1 biosynthesis ATPase subunit